VTLGDGVQIIVAVGSTLTVAVGRSGRHVGLTTAVGGIGVAVGCGGHTLCLWSRRPPRRRLLVTYQPITGRATANL